MSPSWTEATSALVPRMRTASSSVRMVTVFPSGTFWAWKSVAVRVSCVRSMKEMVKVALVTPLRLEQPSGSWIT